jgi:hypothetical protein
VSPITHDRLSEDAAVEQAKQILGRGSAPPARAKAAVTQRSSQANPARLRAAIADINTALRFARSVRADLDRFGAVTQTALKQLQALLAHLVRLPAHAELCALVSGGLERPVERCRFVAFETSRGTTVTRRWWLPAIRRRRRGAGR